MHTPYSPHTHTHIQIDLLWITFDQCIVCAWNSRNIYVRKTKHRPMGNKRIAYILWYFRFEFWMKFWIFIFKWVSGGEQNICTCFYFPSFLRLIVSQWILDFYDFSSEFIFIVESLWLTPWLWNEISHFVAFKIIVGIAFSYEYLYIFFHIVNRKEKHNFEVLF